MLFLVEFPTSPWQVTHSPEGHDMRKRSPLCNASSGVSVEGKNFAYHALFRVIVRNPHHVLHPLFPPRKRTICKLRKLSHGFTIPPVCSSLMRKNYLIRMLYTDVHWHLSFICVAFYPRDAMLARVIEIATCLSVRHAPVLCQNEES